MPPGAAPDGAVPSWFCMVTPPVAAPPGAGGALCCTAAPPVSLPPVPCALAKLVPASSAIAATDIINRLVILCLLACWLMPARSTKRGETRSGRFPVPSLLFVERLMNGGREPCSKAQGTNGHKKPAAAQPVVFADGGR